MSHRLTYGVVRDGPRRVIHAVRVQDEILDTPEIADIAERMRERLASRGETIADVVVIQGDRKETLRLFGIRAFAAGNATTFLMSGAIFAGNTASLVRRTSARADSDSFDVGWPQMMTSPSLGASSRPSR